MDNNTLEFMPQNSPSSLAVSQDRFTEQPYAIALNSSDSLDSMREAA